MISTWFPDIHITFNYISEAHAIDVWPIGDSAGVANKKHMNINDRSTCASNFIKEYDFNITTYLDNMNDEFRDTLSSWPFRFYLVKYDDVKSSYVFEYIAMPDDSEFDFSILLDFLQK
jgi:hypothetical protein